MKTRDVCWLQGALVHPHHFQAQAAATQNFITASTNWTTPFDYGVYSIELEREELNAGNLSITRLKARLRDGTLVSVPENGLIGSVNFKKALADAGIEGLYVYITLPRVQPGRQNAVRLNDETRPDDETHRYFIREGGWFDLNYEDDEQTLDYYFMNVRLSVNTVQEPPDGYISIPLLRLLPPTRKDDHPKIDPDFFPPLLSCGCWPEMRELLATIETRLEAFIQRQAQALDHENAWTQVTTPRVNRAIFMLNAVNSAFPVVRQMVALTHWQDQHPLYLLHPYQIYLELCRLVGQLGLVTRNWQAPMPPLYNHDRLGEVFREIQALIDQLLTPFGPSAKLQRLPFVGTENWLEVTLGDHVKSECQFYIGIESQLSPQQLSGLFAERHLDWKLGSRSTISRIYRNAEPGLRLILVDDTASALPRVPGRTYFQIDACGDYWDEVVQDPTLALRLNRRFVQGSFQGSNQVTVLTEDGVEQDLSFWLWVIQNENVISSEGGAADPSSA